MEVAKSKLIFVALIAVVIVTASVGIYLIRENGGITAKEGEVIVSPIAKNWNSSAVLLVASKGSDMRANGEFVLWYFKYTNTLNITNTSQCIEIKVYSGGDTEVSYNMSIADKKPINSWLIDSDEAYEISLTQTELSEGSPRLKPGASLTVDWRS